MFKTKADNLPPDPKYPANLKELGFFINDAGQVRMIAYPDKEFVYHFTNNERHNEVRNEASQICSRRETYKRLSSLGIEKLYLPQLTTTKPEGEPSVPILAPPCEILKTRKRIIVVVNDTLQDLGILAYRQLQRELGISGASIVNFAKEIITRSRTDTSPTDLFKDGAGIEDTERETPGLIVMNCGQLLYSYGLGEAISTRSWNALPRASMCHDPVSVTPFNHIPGNYDANEHIRFVLDQVIANKEMVDQDAEVYVVAIENGGEHLLDILGKDLNKYASRITAIAFVNTLVYAANVPNPELRTWLHQRARLWHVYSGSNDPDECIEVPAFYAQEIEILDSSANAQNDSPTSDTTVTPPVGKIDWLETVATKGTAGIVGIISDVLHRFNHLTLSPKSPGTHPSTDQPDTDAICPTFPDAENPHAAGECVFTAPAVQRCILSFFETVARDPAGFRNPVFQATASAPGPEWGGVRAEFDNEEEEAELGRAIENDSNDSDERDGNEDAAYRPLQPAAMTPEQADLDEKRSKLQAMRDALRDTSTSDTALAAGRQNLIQRIAQTEKLAEQLAEKALASGALRAGEAEDVRDNWRPVRRGPRIPFAGTMVDSELVRAAGLNETAERELAGLDDSGGEEEEEEEEDTN